MYGRSFTVKKYFFAKRKRKKDEHWKNTRLIVWDCLADNEELVSLAWIVFESGSVLEKHEYLIKPSDFLTEGFVQKTWITNQQIINADTVATSPAVGLFLKYVINYPITVSFDPEQNNPVINKAISAIKSIDSKRISLTYINTPFGSEYDNQKQISLKLLNGVLNDQKSVIDFYQAIERNRILKHKERPRSALDRVLIQSELLMYLISELPDDIFKVIRKQNKQIKSNKRKDRRNHEKV